MTEAEKQDLEKAIMERYKLAPDAGELTSTSGITQAPSETIESEGVEPETDVRGMTGAATRGLTVPAAQS
jgi:hypothetical protein